MLNNALAVFRGLHLRGGEFVRTPKSGSTREQKARSRYIVGARADVDSKIALGIYSLWTFERYIASERYFFSVFLFLYGMGFLWMGWLSRPRRPETDSVAKAVEATPAQVT